MKKAFRYRDPATLLPFNLTTLLPCNLTTLLPCNLVPLFFLLALSGFATAQGQAYHLPANREMPHAEASGYTHALKAWADDSEWKSIPLSEAGTHELGDSIAQKFCLVRKLYTYQTEVSPGSPAMRTVIRKPVLYNALNRVEKFLKKEVGKGAYSEEKVREIIDHVLNVTITLHAEDSKNIETAIHRSGTNEELLRFFSGVRLLKQ